MAAELDESTRRVIEAFDRLSGRLSTEEEKREELNESLPIENHQPKAIIPDFIKVKN